MTPLTEKILKLPRQEKLKLMEELKQDLGQASPSLRKEAQLYPQAIAPASSLNLEPLTQSLVGILDLTEDEEKEARLRYLEQKHA